MIEHPYQNLRGGRWLVGNPFFCEEGEYHV